MQGGKDAASPRYIFTCLEAVARSLFHPEDDQLLKFLDDDGQSIEPSFYLPVLPMILVNGADGIGTGWSTFVPNFNPQEVIECLRAMLNAEEDDDEVELNELHPWYRGFGGEIEAKTGKDKGSYVVRGAFEEVDENTIKITELPVRTWTQGYKQFLESMLSGAPDSKDAGLVKDFRENHTDRQGHFTVTFADGVLASIKAAPGGVLKKLKLETTISTSNMHLFDANGQIKRYSAATQVIREYFPHRLALYASRKEAMLRKMEAEHSKLSNQVRFILAVISGELVVSNRPKRELLAELQAQKYSLVANAQKRDDAVMDEVHFDPTILDGRGTRGLDVPKTNWANKLDHPPYEAYQITCGITFTFGGLKIDPQSGQVMDVDMHPIPGLYAAGELVGGLFFFNYPGGTGLTSGSVFGRLAGTSAGEAARRI